MKEEDLIVVRASDVRMMMDFYQREVNPHSKYGEADDCYKRLWNAIESKKECSNCRGTGSVSVSVLHPSNPNLDSWEARLCSVCSGKGVIAI